jgi:hypothetical protein
MDTVGHQYRWHYPGIALATGTAIYLALLFIWHCYLSGTAIYLALLSQFASINGETTRKCDPR